jgi:hypothetical protein
MNEQNDELKAAVLEAVKIVEAGLFFDAHFVIDYLLQHEADTYLATVQNYKHINAYHSEIAKQIDKIVTNEGIATREGESISKNICDNFSECTCWKKVKK